VLGSFVTQAPRSERAIQQPALNGSLTWPGNYYIIIVTIRATVQSRAENNNTTVSSAVAITRRRCRICHQQCYGPLPAIAVRPLWLDGFGFGGAVPSAAGGPGLSVTGWHAQWRSFAGDFSRPSTLWWAVPTRSRSAHSARGGRWLLVFVVVTNATGSVMNRARRQQSALPRAVCPDAPGSGHAKMCHPASAQSGSPLTVTWNVSDSGSGPVSGSWIDNVYLSADGAWIAPPRCWHRGAPSALVVGGSYTSSLTANVPNGTNGNFYIIVVTDAAERSRRRGGKANNTPFQRAAVTLAPYAD